MGATQAFAKSKATPFSEDIAFPERLAVGVFVAGTPATVTTLFSMAASMMPPAAHASAVHVRLHRGTAVAVLAGQNNTTETN
jgi:hypothetical protein